MQLFKKKNLYIIFIDYLCNVKSKINIKMKTNDLLRKLSLNTMMVLSLVFSGFMNSCSNNEDVVLSEDEQLKLQEQTLLTSTENSDTDYLLPDGEYSFIFEGKTYTYTLTGGQVECNNGTQNVLNFLNSFGDKLITVINDDQVVEYFTSENAYSRKYLKTRSGDVDYRTTSVTLYRNKNYWGSRSHYYFDSRNGATQTNTGVSWGVSSIKGQVDHVDVPLSALFSVDFSDQDNLSGRILRYSLNNQSLSVSNLKNVPLYPGSSENWNDRIKSLKLY